MSIRVALAGIGNCASSFVQGIEYYRKHPEKSFQSPFENEIDAKVQDIEFVAAFDVDQRKVGRLLSEAIFSPPNTSKVFFSNFSTPSVVVKKSRTLDGISDAMKSFGETGFDESDQQDVSVSDELLACSADILICYLPVGSEKAVEYLAQESLRAGCGFINCVPVFLSQNQVLMRAYKQARVPFVGDDIKSQVGATAVHRALVNQISTRGANIISSYQLNYGGNSDFLNMLDRTRLKSKKISKTEAVLSAIHKGERPALHVGPTEHISFLRDKKEAIIDIKWLGWAGVEMSLKVQMEVEDSPNSAAVVVDAVRVASMAQKKGLGGPLEALSAYCMKSPPKDTFSDMEAFSDLKQYLIELKTNEKQ